MKRQHAFTLVELMTAVAIVAILAAVGVSSYRTFSAKGKWGEVMPCINDAGLRMENYRNNHGRYPTDADVWAALNSSGDCSDHYEGAITVFDNGAHYTIAFCDRKKSIWDPEKLDIWVTTDTIPTAVHYRNPIEEQNEAVPETYTDNFPSDCQANW